MARLTLWMTALILGLPAFAYADSDGFFCAGRGYLAYETHFTAGASEHVLHVVRFSRTDGIAQEQRIHLADFQVHGMSCSEGRIELAAWSTRYFVDLSVPDQPRIGWENAAFDSQRTTQTNLGNWSREGVIDLVSDGQLGEFQLVIIRVSRRVAGGIEHYTVTQLIRRETRLGGRILSAQKIFEGIFLETTSVAETGAVPKYPLPLSSQKTSC
jgi:hypothetical protein